MKIALFLLLTNSGWIKFEEYNSFAECRETRDRIVSENPDRIEGFCCLVTESECFSGR